MATSVMTLAKALTRAEKASFRTSLDACALEVLAQRIAQLEQLVEWFEGQQEFVDSILVESEPFDGRNDELPGRQAIYRLANAVAELAVWRANHVQPRVRKG